MSLAPRTSASAPLRVVDGSVLVQRLLQSLEIGAALQVPEASGALARLRAQIGATEMPVELRASIQHVLAATEQAVRAERPQWAAAIREELALLGGLHQSSAIS